MGNRPDLEVGVHVLCLGDPDVGLSRLAHGVYRGICHHSRSQQIELSKRSLRLDVSITWVVEEHRIVGLVVRSQHTRGWFGAVVEARAKLDADTSAVT